MSNLMRRLWARYRIFLIVVALLHGTFQVLTSAIVSSLDLPNTLAGVLAFAPPALRTLVESTMALSSDGFVALTWNHPATHALVTAVAIALGSGAIAGEIDNGAIELVLAQPLSRVRYLGAHMAFAVLAMLAVSVTGLLGTLAGQKLFGIEASAGARLAYVLANFLLLQLSLYALTLLLSSFGREGGRVAAAASLVAIASFLVNTIATLWSKAVVIKPYSLHSYYDPRAILVDGHQAWLSMMVLGVCALAGMAGAWRRFLTRDLP